MVANLTFSILASKTKMYHQLHTIQVHQKEVQHLPCVRVCARARAPACVCVRAHTCAGVKPAAASISMDTRVCVGASVRPSVRSSACMARVGCPQGRKGSDTGHVALGKGLRRMCSLPVAEGEVPQVRREVRDWWVRGVKLLLLGGKRARGGADRYFWAEGEIYVYWKEVRTIPIHSRESTEHARPC